MIDALVITVSVGAVFLFVVGVYLWRRGRQLPSDQGEHPRGPRETP